MDKLRVVDYQERYGEPMRVGYLHKITGGYMSQPFGLIETEKGQIVEVPLDKFKFKTPYGQICNPNTGGR